ncbi:MAG: sn-glycerol-3-phosphate ABC transporter substrate-binding protein UgpB [Alphaproteobacteria bacterium]|jgi:sn-glycerol 3-phosphate transport system substrate-binding protein|nr:sn-glycerol-3-phosphate ABC transporter substrate-binding protein UgpB [Alphaproteobacteria bacterium]MBU1552973.1 sn-glycerol-3-phosphate ABC transporter substrate-binding protein UgpB [Alphaproteobacteria bacterium]MBU2338267.1 sn-glycerol-3-phosphate ABC transporter substrate-binding protein UgpB [Alphaproteobacteria bacterium]MBU2388246.1 sn-glycerol-3-phosphate ABC transporter substrate-binding protein UgpB [Alphaproteobacteria bacterium]
MSTKIIAASAAAASMSLFWASSALAVTELQWWHAMTGANNEVVDTLAKEFNETQSDYKIVPVFKGTYPETLNAGIAAFRAKQTPAIIQVFDVGTGVMMSAEGAVMPVADVLQKGGYTFDKANYLAGIVAYYSKPDGTMLSFPYNSSSPILYYNKDIFQKAGLDTENPPKTWPEVWEAARKIKTSGAAECGYTSTWLTWIQTENFAAWNNLSYANNENGLADTDVELQFNSPQFVEHFQSIADLAKDGVFRYGGRTSEAKNLFLSGECAILTESSGGLGDIVKSGMNYGIGQLPYYEGDGRPQNTIPGGASLWVFGGKSDEEYKGIAEFFNFLSQTQIQARLHQVSGYLPVTMEAYNATKESGFYEKNPGRETPIQQMMGKEPTENSKGVRLVNLPQVRDILNEEFEAMLAGQQDAKAALDKAVERGNAAIQQALGN